MKASLPLAALPLFSASIASAQVDTDLPPNFPEEYVFAQGARTTVGAYGELLRVYVDWSAGSKSITITRRDREDTNTDFVDFGGEFSTSYHITDVALRDAGQEVFISGVTDSGSTIVERWRWPRSSGRMVSTLSGTPTIGSPQGPFLMTVAPHGGVWSPPGRLPAPSKVVLHQGTIGPFMQIAVDPEGRYMLLHSKLDASLYRIDGLDGPSGSGSPFVLYSAAQVPQLTDVGALEVYDYDGEGRIIVFSNNISHNLNDVERVHFRDNDNDGVIDSHSAYTFDQMLESHYAADESKWNYPYVID